MHEKDENAQTKHYLFSLSMIGSFVVAIAALLLAMTAGNDGHYTGAGICLIAAAISFGVVKITNLMLIKY